MCYIENAILMRVGWDAPSCPLSLTAVNHTHPHTPLGKKNAIFEKNLSKVHQYKRTFVLDSQNDPIRSCLVNNRAWPPASASVHPRRRRAAAVITAARSWLIYEAINILLSVTSEIMQHEGRIWIEMDSDSPFPSAAWTENCCRLFRWKAVITLIKGAQIKQAQTN